MNIKLFDMVLCFSRALDLLHPRISDHHLRVAYVGACVAEALGLSAAETQDVLIAGALHDVGAVSSTTRLALLEYALSHYQFDGAAMPEDLHRHGDEGYLLTRDFPPFAAAAPMIRFHHVEWDFGRGGLQSGSEVPLGGHILSLADRVAVMPEPERNILAQAAGMRARVAEAAGRRFKPAVVEAFLEVSTREAFWLDVASPHKEAIIRSRFSEREVALDLDALYELARVFGRIIDYRSPFTATHSSGVAATAEALAARAGLSAVERRLVGVAGFLHDLGKLAVPVEILDKPGRLSEEEMFVVRQHPYHTHRILAAVPGLDTVNQWASWHHERLDGGGYPFRPAELPFGARLIAVADVFTAVTEDRPYRRGMDRAQTLRVLDQHVREGAIDGDIVALLHGDFEAIDRIRNRSQRVPETVA